MVKNDEIDLIGMYTCTDLIYFARTQQRRPVNGGAGLRNSIHHQSASAPSQSGEFF